MTPGFLIRVLTSQVFLSTSLQRQRWCYANPCRTAYRTHVTRAQRRNFVYVDVTHVMEMRKSLFVTGTWINVIGYKTGAAKDNTKLPQSPTGLQAIVIWDAGPGDYTQAGTAGARYATALKRRRKAILNSRLEVQIPLSNRPLETRHATASQKSD